MSGPQGAGDAYNAAVTVSQNRHAERHATSRGKAYPATVTTSPPIPAESNS